MLKMATVPRNQEKFVGAKDPPSRGLAKPSGLTPAEGRLAALMAQALSPEQAAERFPA
jgi:DNA-binding CsgD family transcriptional regulator